MLPHHVLPQLCLFDVKRSLRIIRTASLGYYYRAAFILKSKKYITASLHVQNKVLETAVLRIITDFMF